MKCAAAVALGRLGGKRSAELRVHLQRPADERSDAARRAARARWAQARAKPHKVIPHEAGVERRRWTGELAALVECRFCGVRVLRDKFSRWRHSPQARGFYKTSREADQRWPYGITTDALVVEVNDAIPRNVPEQVREEACQELVLAVLEGRVTRGDLRDAAKAALKAARSGYQFSARFEVSMDIPLGQDARTPLRDLLAGSDVVDVARILPDDDHEPGWLAA